MKTATKRKPVHSIEGAEIAPYCAYDRVLFLEQRREGKEVAYGDVLKDYGPDFFGRIRKQYQDYIASPFLGNFIVDTAPPIPDNIDTMLVEMKHPNKGEAIDIWGD